MRSKISKTSLLVILNCLLCQTLFASDELKIFTANNETYLVCNKEGYYDLPDPLKGRVYIKEGFWHCPSKSTLTLFMEIVENIKTAPDSDTANKELKKLKEVFQSGKIFINSIRKAQLVTYAISPVKDTAMFLLINNLEAVKLFREYGAKYTLVYYRLCQSKPVLFYLEQKCGIDPFENEDIDHEEDGKCAYFSSENISRLSQKDLNRRLRPNDYREIGVALRKLSQTILTKVTPGYYFGAPPEFTCFSREEAQKLVKYLNGIGLEFYYINPNSNSGGVYLTSSGQKETYNKRFIETIIKQLKLERPSINSKK